MAEALEALVDLPRDVRIHWTGCPNSCGQVQVGDIGLMGAPAKVRACWVGGMGPGACYRGVGAGVGAWQAVPPQATGAVGMCFSCGCQIFSLGSFVLAK